MFTPLESTADPGYHFGATVWVSVANSRHKSYLLYNGSMDWRLKFEVRIVVSSLDNSSLPCSKHYLKKVKPVVPLESTVDQRYHCRVTVWVPVTNSNHNSYLVYNGFKRRFHKTKTIDGLFMSLTTERSRCMLSTALKREPHSWKEKRNSEINSHSFSIFC